MKRAVFEVSTFADAVSKANRIAPLKGTGFDKAAGIIIDVDPMRFAEQVIIKSTDLEVTFRAVVNFLELGDEACVWRVPSSLLSAMASTLPSGSGATVEIRETKIPDSWLYFIAGKAKTKLKLIDATDYPLIPAFDGTLLTNVPGFAKRVQQVAWATDAKAAGSALSGVHIDGNFMYGCNRQCLAIVPCQIPVDRPVTAPLYDIAALIKNTGEVALRADEFHMQIMPDGWTQTTCSIIVLPYPNVLQLLTNDYTGTFEISRESFEGALARTMVLSKADRYPVTTLEIGHNFLKFEMDAGENGKVVDELEVVGGVADGQPTMRIVFTPDLLVGALQASGRPFVKMDFGPHSGSKCRLYDDNEFQCIIMPRAK